MDADTPLVTVIVPVRNEAKCIERTLTKILTQRYPADRFEVIVADGCSTDATVPIVRGLQARFPNLRLLHNPRRLASAARNLGVQHGNGDLFVVIDGHCDVDDPDYLRKMVDAFRASGADCLGRPQPLEIARPTALQEAIAMARRCWLGHNPDSYIYAAEPRFVKASSVAVAYRRSVFERVGQFDEQFDACEDVEFNHRVDEAGLRCWFTPDIAVHYHPRTSLKGLMVQMGRYGRGRIRLAVKHPRSLTAPAVAPLSFFLTLAACGLVAPFSVWLGVIGMLLAGTYLGVILLTSLSLLRRPGRLVAKAWLPLVFVAIHTGFAWGTFREINRQLHSLVFQRRTRNESAPAHQPLARAA